METQAEDNVSAEQSDIDKVLEKINEIARISATGDYIYRGEPECYEKVSSSLYREYEINIEAEKFDITVVQKEILNEAREYTPHKDVREILTELQHYGGKTNLIDFTTDYLVALFFACDGSPNLPSRIILLGKESEAYDVLKPPRTIRRAEAQKSIFVQAQQGFVTPDKIVYIPSELKGDILEYLRKHHDISTKTIYNDLHGFIKNRSSHKSAYTEFYKGLTCQGRGDSAKNTGESFRWYGHAIMHYTTAIELNPEVANIYYNRGKVYHAKREMDNAIQDYSKVIELNPEAYDVYVNRGNAYSYRGVFDLAMQDYSKAIELNPNNANTYYNRGLAYRKHGFFEKALQDFNKAIELDPEDAEAHQYRDKVQSYLKEQNKTQ